MRIKMLFDEQNDRFRCFFNWLIFLTTLTIIVVSTLMIRKKEGAGVLCSIDGDYWQFESCAVRSALKILHVVTTMQCAAMARKVFGRVVEKVARKELYEKLITKESEEDWSEEFSGKYSDAHNERDLKEYKGDSNYHKITP